MRRISRHGHVWRKFAMRKISIAGDRGRWEEWDTRRRRGGGDERLVPFVYRFRALTSSHRATRQTCRTPRAVLPSPWSHIYRWDGRNYPPLTVCPKRLHAYTRLRFVPVTRVARFLRMMNHRATPEVLN